MPRGGQGSGAVRRQIPTETLVKQEPYLESIFPLDTSFHQFEYPASEPYYDTLCLAAVNTNYFLKITKHFPALPRL